MQNVLRMDNCMEYEIVIAQNKEKDAIVEFYNREWKKSQIINESKLFDFYFRNGNDLQFVLVKRKDDNQIAGASGYFLSSKKDVWLSNTCIKSGENPFLIFRIIDYFKQIAPNIHDVNCTDNMKRIFERAGFQTGEYVHFFRVIKKCDYEIIQIPDQLKMPLMDDCAGNVKEIYQLDEIQNVLSEKLNPAKTVEYIWHRYKEFPYKEYEYRIWLAKQEKKEALIVTREQKAENSLILRIVDIIGHIDCLKSAMKYFIYIGEKKNYEYIDCFCCGISIDTMREYGFVDNLNHNCVVPDNFSPLIRENVSINFATNNIQGFRAFKADGDMDRPNLWR